MHLLLDGVVVDRVTPDTGTAKAEAYHVGKGNHTVVMRVFNASDGELESGLRYFDSAPVEFSIPPDTTKAYSVRPVGESMLEFQSQEKERQLQKQKEVDELGADLDTQVLLMSEVTLFDCGESCAVSTLTVFSSRNKGLLTELEDHSEFRWTRTVTYIVDIVLARRQLRLQWSHMLMHLLVAGLCIRHGLRALCMP